MNLTILEISLMALALVLMAAMAYIIYRRRRLLLDATRRIERRYAFQLREAQDEIQRLSTINADLARRTNDAAQPSPSTKTELSRFIDTDAIVAEQRKLEQQQLELSERNRQLWDMSLSIEKERKHIQTLKNEIEREHKSVTDSIRYAKLIQNAILPSAEILKESFSDVFLFWRPRDIVSGDFYWMRRIGDTVIFTVADCTGHGVPGAFMSMLGVAFLNEICVDFGPDTHPAQILEQMRTKVITTLKQKNDLTEQKDGMDMGLCVLNLNTMTMQFAGANNGMYLVRGTELTEYKPVKNPIAIYPRMKSFESVDVEIQHGDYIYMFSDGFADQFSGASNRKYTYGRLKQLLCDINAKTKIAAEQSALLDAAATEWRGTYRQMDDILIGGYCVR